MNPITAVTRAVARGLSMDGSPRSTLRTDYLIDFAALSGKKYLLNFMLAKYTGNQQATQYTIQIVREIGFRIADAKGWRMESPRTMRRAAELAVQIHCHPRLGHLCRRCQGSGNSQAGQTCLLCSGSGVAPQSNEFYASMLKISPQAYWSTWKSRVDALVNILSGFESELVSEYLEKVSHETL